MLGSVLILAREEVVAALLGLMVEVCGFQPKFAGENESAENAIGDKRPYAVLLDCDHPEFSEKLIENSPFRMHAEVSRLASQHGTRSFTLPTEPNVFARILGP